MDGNKQIVFTYKRYILQWTNMQKISKKTGSSKSIQKPIIKPPNEMIFHSKQKVNVTDAKIAMFLKKSGFID